MLLEDQVHMSSSVRQGTVNSQLPSPPEQISNITTLASSLGEYCAHFSAAKMWSLIANLPAEVVGHNVLPMLNCIDVVRLDSAVLHTECRPTLHELYRFVKVSNVKHQEQLPALQWCTVRDLSVKWTWLSISANFGAFFSLLAANGKIVCDNLRISTNGQMALDDIQEAFKELKSSNKLFFEFCPRGKVTFRAPAAFAGRLNALIWNTADVTTDDASALVSSNPNISRMIIHNPAAQELNMAASLGSSLRTVSLTGTHFSDADLTAFGQQCHNLNEFSIDRSHTSVFLDAGIIRVAQNNKELQAVYLDGIVVSDQAITALCAYCPHDCCAVRASEVAYPSATAGGRLEGQDM
jgi:hypothetical protein